MCSVKKNNKEISNVTVSKCTLLTSQILQSDFSQLLLGITVIPRESKNKVMQDFLGEVGGGGILGPAIIKQMK